MSYERRLAPRVPCNVYVREVNDEASGFLCQAMNVSETGMYLRRLQGGVLLEGEQVQLEFSLPGDETPIWATARVVDQVEETMHEAAGVQFSWISGDDRRRLKDHVRGERTRRLRMAVSGLAGGAQSPRVVEPRVRRANRRAAQLTRRLREATATSAT